VGDRQDSRRLAILDLVERKRAWAYVEGVTLPVEEKKEKPPEAAEPGDEEKADGEPTRPREKGREVRYGLPVLSPGGARAVSLVYAADNKDRYIVLVDPVTGRARPLETLHDEAGSASRPPARWMGGRPHRVVPLGAHGYQHLYTMDVEAAGASPRP
jgi:hypothetical protein